MLDKETRKRIEDYFDPVELVDFLLVTTEEIIDALEEKVEEYIDELEEFMGVREKMTEEDE